MRPALLSGWRGIGDTIYTRPAIRAQSSHRIVFVDTAWPEIFADLRNVQFVRPEANLRTQRKHAATLPPETWSPVPADAERLRPRQHWGHGSIAESVKASVSLMGEPFVFDLPPAGPSPVSTDRPVAVVRPVTLRREWLNPARAPAAEYVATAAAALQSRGYHVVSVADVDGDEEWLVEPAPRADEVFHRGELPLQQLINLVAGAAVVVGGVGWIVPMCVALQTPAVVIGGGCGRSNNPEWLTGGLDASRMRWLLPDDYCMCSRHNHDCPKEITGFDARFGRALEEATA